MTGESLVGSLKTGIPTLTKLSYINSLRESESRPHSLAFQVVSDLCLTRDRSIEKKAREVESYALQVVIGLGGVSVRGGKRVGTVGEGTYPAVFLFFKRLMQVPPMRHT